MTLSKTKSPRKANKKSVNKAKNTSEQEQFSPPVQKSVVASTRAQQVEFIELTELTPWDEDQYRQTVIDRENREAEIKKEQMIKKKLEQFESYNGQSLEQNESLEGVPSRLSKQAAMTSRKQFGSKFSKKKTQHKQEKSQFHQMSDQNFLLLQDLENDQEHSIFYERDDLSNKNSDREERHNLSKSYKFKSSQRFKKDRSASKGGLK